MHQLILMQGSAHLGVVLFVNFAAHHGRGEVVTAPVGVQTGKKPVVWDGLPQAMHSGQCAFL